MIIGLTGKKRSGKDTAASVFVDNGFIKYRFADPLKDACRSIFLWYDEHIEGDLKEVIDSRWGISPRQAMQYLGTEVGREALPNHFPTFKSVIGSGIWIRRFKYWYEKDPTRKVIIPDVRFLNEAKTIKDLGGKIIKIVRPSETKKDNHISEKEIDLIVSDYLVFNDGSIENFLSKIKIYFDGIIRSSYENTGS